MTARPKPHESAERLRAVPAATRRSRHALRTLFVNPPWTCAYDCTAAPRRKTFCRNIHTGLRRAGVSTMRGRITGGEIGAAAPRTAYAPRSRGGRGTAAAAEASERWAMRASSLPLGAARHVPKRSRNARGPTSALLLPTRRADADRDRRAPRPAARHREDAHASRATEDARSAARQV